MRIRGNRGAWFGWPVGVVLLVVISAILMAPRPVRPETGAADPSGSGRPPAGALTLGSPGASTPGGAGPSAGLPSSGPSAATGGDPSQGATAAPVLPTPGPTVAPPTIGPTTSPTFPPTTRPPVNPTAPPPPPPTAGPTPAPPTQPPPTAGPVPPLSACSIFPSSNVWNRKVDGLPVAANSATMIAAIGLGASLHPDFSDGGGYGIPFNIVGTSTPRSTVAFQYDDESDHVGYPIPAAPKIEGGSDRHILMIDTNDCVLYELFAASHGSGGWHAGSGAVWDLGSNALRPAGWTSADAAGLPIFPGLVRYSEVASGVIKHAIRFTAPDTCDDYIYPARHEAGDGACSGGGASPPMGLRVRLKASVNISDFGPQSEVILTALKQYGMLLADNGSPWYITGAPDSHWDDDELHDLGQLEGSDFEVVDTTGFVNG